MIIISRLTEKDFVKASFILLSKKISVRILMIVFACGILSGILAAIFSPRAFNIDQFLPVILFLLLFTLIYYFLIKRAFVSNKRSGENIEYQFEDENLTIKGESFNSKLSWDKIYKVTQTKNWIFIWHSSQTANPIKKQDIWIEQRDQLKEILSKHKVKNNL